MARTINEIKESIVSSFTSNSNVRELYGYAEGEDFVLSKVSIENLIFYVCACAIYVMECLFDKHTEEIEKYIHNNLPHTCRWYSNTAKDYRHGATFDTETMSWTYDGSSEPTEEEIAESKVVKNCAVSENDIQVLMKVSGEGPAPLTTEQLTGLQSYMQKVKDAGVYLVYRNAQADKLKLSVHIWYDPAVINSQGEDISLGTETVKDCIENFISNLPFDGEFRLDKLEDAIQQVEGVEIVHITKAQTQDPTLSNPQWYDIIGFASPYSGYYKCENTDLQITYIAKLYEN